jgi:hypothetical protein
MLGKAWQSLSQQLQGHPHDRGGSGSLCVLWDGEAGEAWQSMSQARQCTHVIEVVV